jgi:hypothetical protein
VKRNQKDAGTGYETLQLKEFHKKKIAKKQAEEKNQENAKSRKQVTGSRTELLKWRRANGNCRQDWSLMFIAPTGLVLGGGAGSQTCPN